jgi:CxxC-x17-CxxC domain-containing protein
MGDEDRTLVCSDCGAEFAFTAGEQEFYRQKGFTHEPKRCKNCRAGKRAGGGGAKHSRRSGPQQPSHMEYAGSLPQQQRAPSRAKPDSGPYEVTCSQCGALTRLPFRPDGVRPVFCRSCFQDRKRSHPQKGGAA